MGDSEVKKQLENDCIEAVKHVLEELKLTLDPEALLVCAKVVDYFVTVCVIEMVDDDTNITTVDDLVRPTPDRSKN